MKYQFFKDTGIQFFGDPSIPTKIELNEDEVVDASNGKTNLQFSHRLLSGEWLPLAIDNERNLTRFLYHNNKPIIYSIDTTIRDNNGDTYKNSLTKTDVASSLTIGKGLKDNSTNLHNRIIVNEFIKGWVKDIYNRKCSNPKFQDFLKANPTYSQFSEVFSYQLLLSIIIKTNPNFIPKIDILADHAAAADVIDTNLYIDLGNSRTIGLFIEKDINNNNYNIKNAAPLKILNYKTIERDGAKYLNDYATRKESDFDYLISSNLKFKENIFAKYPESINFNLPNIVCLGSEGDDLIETQMQTPNTGISGPKRYLWSDSQEKQYWNFHNTNELNNNIRGKILKYIPLDDNDNVLNNIYNEACIEKPMKPMYPKRTMMIFAMVEIIYQAFIQMNSLHYRKRVGNILIKRQLENIIISFPTAMPFWERKRLIKQSKKALIILQKLNSIPYDITIALGSDEATCSQIAFLYGEAKRFPGQGELFFNLISGKRRPSKLRIASLDIGGGTTDLMIADYERSNIKMAQNSDLSQKIIYSDGINFAGDDILNHLITTFVIERLRNAAIKHNSEDKFNEYFGAGAPEADKQMRVEAMNSLFIPIAEFYMYYMSQSESIPIAEIDKIKTIEDLNSIILKPRNLKLAKVTNYFKIHDILHKTFQMDAKIPNLIPSVQDLENEVFRVYQDILYRFSWVIGQHRPDFLILAGKTTSLPIIARKLRENITIPPSKIIALKDYFIGAWHPFSKNGIVNDPKTSVVVGNAISHISIDKEMSDVNIASEGSKSNFTLNFIGANVNGQTFNDLMTIYNSTSPKVTPFYLQNKVNILFRNIDDPNMLCNLMYQIELNRKNGIKISKNPLEIIVDTNNPKNELKIESVKGEVFDTNTNQDRTATKEDLIIREKTLLDDEYYLDNGVFGVKNI